MKIYESLLRNVIKNLIKEISENENKKIKLIEEALEIIKQDFNSYGGQDYFEFESPEEMKDNYEFTDIVLRTGIDEFIEIYFSEEEEDIKLIHNLFYNNLIGNNNSNPVNDLSINNNFTVYSTKELSKEIIDIKFYDPAIMQIESTNMFKPKGLWFGIGDSWKVFCRQNNFDESKYQFKYNIKIDISKVYILNSLEKLQDFEEKYLSNYNKIDWAKVTDDYSGVIMYDSVIGTKNWTSTWDITSGCLWKSDALLSLQKVKNDMSR